MKKFKTYIFIFIATFVAVLFVGCKDNTQEPKPPVPPTDIERTIIIYMVANNNLSSYAKNNINEIESAFSEQYGGRILLFYNDLQGNCRLYNIVHDNDRTTIHSPVIKEYAFKTNPCLPETLAGVVADCRAYSQTDSYSIIFWSHGTGWIPQGMAPPRALEVDNPSSVVASNGPQYTFGAVDSFEDQLEIWELADALPRDIVFDFISFDACYMSCVELAYELRDNTKYLMASAAEILAEGYPYQNGLQYALTGDVVGMSKCFFDHYNLQYGVMRSATTAVIDCSKLPAVAAELKKLVALGTTTVRTQQQFGRNLGRSANYSNIYWDLGEMAKLTWGERAGDFTAALEEAVVYKATTPILFENDYFGSITVNTFSGLTVYKPLLSQPVTLGIYTEHYDWAADTEFYTLAN